MDKQGYFLISLFLHSKNNKIFISVYHLVISQLKIDFSLARKFIISITKPNHYVVEPLKIILNISMSNYYLRYSELIIPEKQPFISQWHTEILLPSC